MPHISPLPLSEDEKVIFKIRASVLILFFYLVLFVGVGVALKVMIEISELATVISGLVDKQWIDWALIALIAFIDLVIFLRWLLTIYTLTNKRVERRAGIISLDYENISLEHIESVKTKISIFGRLFNYGDVLISSAATFFTINLGGISSPKTRAAQIQELSS